MENVLFYAVLSLGIIGGLSAIILYFVARKFKVEEDTRIEQVTNCLPGANCGGCGYAGCHNFAEHLVQEGGKSKDVCAVCDIEALHAIAKILGGEVVIQEPMVAVVKCGGRKEVTAVKAQYEGMQSCQYASQLYAGKNGCPYSCMGLGDCERVCKFGAIVVNKETALPEVDESKCTACGSCAKVCPRHVIEMRERGKNNRRVYVSCLNKEKGAISSSHCKVSCIGCGKCAKACPFGAIVVENNLSYIDFHKCKLCRKCVAVCPTGAIVTRNFPLQAKEESSEIVIENE
ncbi:MAG: RnfABCDGE type electron transport complex subunit B [Bacteroidales bacterium]